jgi:SET domain-containing protein
MALLDKHLEVKESNIPGAGKGLFTKVFIPKGTRITEYKGRIRTWKEVEGENANYYIFYVNKNHVIDANRTEKSVAKYINDARGLVKIKGLNNNTQFVKEGRLVFVDATKNIPAGCELFVSYGKDYWVVIRNNIRMAEKEAKLKAAK